MQNDFLVERSSKRIRLEFFEMEKFYASGVFMVCINSAYVSNIDVGIEDSTLTIYFSESTLFAAHTSSSEILSFDFTLPEEIETQSAFIRQADQSIFIVFSYKKRLKNAACY